MSKKAAIYVRVSTEEQAERGTSIENQLECLRTHCAAHKIEIYDEYQDPGVSGGTLDRPGLQRLLRDADRGCFGKVLVYRTDRLSRNIPHIARLVLEVFLEKHIEFASITEPYDTCTPSGRLFFNQLAGFADFERETIRERMMEGRMRKAKDGKWVSACAHYAYDVDEHQNLVINEERSKIFRQIVDWALAGKSGRWMENTLNEMGVPTYNQVHGRDKKNTHRAWHQSNIRTMLLNPIIIGKANFKGIEIEAPRLVTEEEFQRIKRQFKGNIEKSQRNTQHFYLLRNIAFCKRCGSKLWGKKKFRQQNHSPDYVDSRYFCPSRNSRETSCGLRSVNLHKIESRIWELTKELVMDSDKLIQAVKARHIDIFANKLFAEDQDNQYKREYSSLQAELDRLLSLYSQGTIFTVEELDAKARQIKDRMGKIDEAQKELLKAEERLAAQKKHLDDAVEYFRSIRSRLNSFSREEKRKLIESIFTRIVVDWDEERREHTLEIEGMVPIFEKEVMEVSGKEPVVNVGLIPRPGGAAGRGGRAAGRG